MKKRVLHMGRGRNGSKGAYHIKGGYVYGRKARERGGRMLLKKLKRD